MLKLNLRLIGAAAILPLAMTASPAAAHDHAAKTATVVAASITEAEVKAAQQAWGSALVAIATVTAGCASGPPPTSSPPAAERSAPAPASRPSVSEQPTRDPSPHDVRFVDVGDVRVEVQDWHGAGAPIVLLP